MLTPKQHELLMLLNERLDANGFGPSYEETALEDLVTTFDSGRFPLPAVWARARKALADAKRAESSSAEIEAWAKASH